MNYPINLSIPRILHVRHKYHEPGSERQDSPHLADVQGAAPEVVRRILVSHVGARRRHAQRVRGQDQRRVHQPQVYHERRSGELLASPDS